MNTYKKHIVILGSLLLLVGAGCTASPESTNESATAMTYENSTHNFEITYPDGWEKQEPSEGPVVMFFSPLRSTDDTFSENVNIIVQDLGGVVTLDQYVEASLEALGQGLQNFELESSERVTVDGTPAERITYTGSYEGTPLKWTQWILLRGSNDYVITYTGEQDQFDAFSEEAADMVASMTFTEKGE